MDLRDYLRVLRRGWPVVLAFVAIGLGGAIALTLATAKVYQASTQLYVSVLNTSDPTQAAQGTTYAQDQVQSLTSVVDSPNVLTRTLINSVNKKFGVDYSLADLQSKVSADAPLNKVLINLHATDHNPQLATYLANHAAASFKTYVEHFEPQDTSGNPLVSLTAYQPAQTPGAPVKPNKILNLVLGFVLGLLLGIGAVILRDVLDTTVKGPDDFEALGIPVLGMVPLDKRTQRQPIAFRADPHSARSEAYRQLRTNLQFVNVDKTPRVIAVTSAIPGEGKTTTAMNLAAALADAGHRVVLVEADLRRPNIAKTLGLVGEVGFTTVLIGQVQLEDALQNAGRNLAVLTSGPIPPNPSELLITDQAKQLIAALAERADFVIIDTAPLLPVADGSEVAALADATLVVHRAGKTTRDQAARCAEALAKVGERAVGVVLNMISRATGSYEYQYSYTYTYRPQRSHSENGTKVLDAQENGVVRHVNGNGNGSVVPGLPLSEDEEPVGPRPSSPPPGGPGQPS